MAEPNHAGPHEVDVPIEPDAAIQFDEAEYTTPVPGGPTCGACQRAIADEYFEINGKVFCASCRQAIETAIRGGSRVGRFLRALILGSIAAVAGAVIYYAILRATGLNIGLVAVVVGAMVGGAVRKGTGNRGGTLYQLLAVFLTYSAIVAMYIPFLLEGFAKRKDAVEKPGVAVAQGEKDAVKAAPQPVAPAPSTNEPTKPKANQQPAPAAALKAPTKDGAQVAPAQTEVAKNQPADANQAEPPLERPAPSLYLILVMLAFLYTLPVQLAVAAPLSGLIFGFALWEAWKMNKKVPWSFSGPFRVSPAHPDTPVLEDETDGA